MKREIKEIWEFIKDGYHADDGWPLGVSRPTNTKGVNLTTPEAVELKKIRKLLEKLL